MRLCSYCNGRTISAFMMMMMICVQHAALYFEVKIIYCIVIGLTESDLHYLLSLNNMVHNLQLTVDVVRNICLGPDDMIPQLLMMKLIRALHGLLQPIPSNRFSHALLIKFALFHCILNQSIKC